jgi:hypothetical protein
VCVWQGRAALVGAEVSGVSSVSYIESKDEGMGWKDFQSRSLLKLICLESRDKIIEALPKFLEIGMLLQKVTTWINVNLTLLYGLQLEKNAFTLKFKGNFKSTIMICNFNHLKHLKPKTFEGPKNLSTFQVPSTHNLQLLGSQVPIIMTQHQKLSKFPRTLTPSKFQAPVTQH